MASFQAPLSMASSQVILQSFRSLFTDSTHVKFSLARPLLNYHHALTVRYAPACTEYAQTISDDIGQASPQSVLPQIYLVYHHSRLGPFLRGHISTSTCAPNCWTCRLLVGQHSAPYNIAGRTAIHYTRRTFKFITSLEQMVYYHSLETSPIQKLIRVVYAFHASVV